MEYRYLGRTGVKVSAVCLGCLNFGGPTSETDAATIIHAALDAGVNFFDTANSYHAGRSETILGKAIKRGGRRARLVIATKFHGSMDDTDPNACGNSRRHIVRQCEESLHRLQTDCIDLYQIHRPSSEMAVDETLRALDDLIRAGKVRYVGTSTFAAWQVMESLWVSKELGLHRVVSEQPPYNLLDRRIERELVPMARTYDIAILPWSPLAEGFLAGKYGRGMPLPKGGRLSQNPQWFSTHFSAHSFAVLDLVQSMAKEKRCTASQVALAWCLRQPGITSPIIGPRTVEHLRDNIKAVSVEITAEDRRRIDHVAPPNQMLVPYYEADFGPHKFFR